MTSPVNSPAGAMERCLGLPLGQARAALHAAGCDPTIIYTGERAAEAGLTPRVIAIRENALIVAYFRDGDPQAEEV